MSTHKIKRVINNTLAKFCFIAIEQQMINPMCATIKVIILNPE